MTSVSTQADLRALFGPVRDQGPRPTCLAFAASDTHAALRGPWAPLSCEYAFYHAQLQAKRPPTIGALLPSMLDTLRLDGQPEESSWVYLKTTPDASQWHPPRNVAALFRREGESKQSTVDEILNELNQKRPVLVLMMLSRSFDIAHTTPIVDPAPDEQPDPARRHAVIAVAHGEVKGQRVVLIRNSWGTAWGHGGYAWFTERYLLTRVFRLAILKEDISVPAHSAAA